MMIRYLHMIETRIILLTILASLCLSGCQQRIPAEDVEEPSSLLLTVLVEQRDLSSLKSVFDMVTDQKTVTPTPANDHLLEEAYRSIAYYTDQDSFVLLDQSLERYTNLATSKTQ